jgi:hypothetical protein
VVFSKNEGLWGWNSRHVVLGSAPPGRLEFEVGPLPPGDYYAAPVPRFDDDQWADVDYLDALSRRAQPVTLTEGELRALRLTMQGR